MTIRACVLALALTASAAHAQDATPLSPPAKPQKPIPHGADLFVSAGCIYCHGTGGAGGEKGPSLKDVRRHMTVAQMNHQIHDGGQSMPPFGDILTPQDISDLTAWLRSKRTK